MGYDIHITRATDWSENHGREISSAEWLAVVNADPDLTSDPDNGLFAVRVQTGQWLDWFEGNVFTTDPDIFTVAKMFGVAQQLAGVVQGDDGEIYKSAQHWADQQPDTPV